MSFLTAASGAVDLVNISIANAGIVALLGYGVVFFGLILLMCVVMALGKAFQAMEAKQKAAAPVAEAPAAAPAAAPALGCVETGLVDGLQHGLELLVGQSGRDQGLVCVTQNGLDKLDFSCHFIYLQNGF